MAVKQSEPTVLELESFDDESKRVWLFQVMIGNRIQDTKQNHG